MGRNTIFLGFALVVLAAVLLLSAWLCDDAYITFRTAENAASGLGMRWNPVERVQTFTHPLWCLLLVGLRLLTGDLYYSTLLVSVVLGVATALLVLLRAPDGLPARTLALLCLVLSRAFVDFSTSGLEGPLAHLLLVLFLVSAAKIQTADRPEGRPVFLAFLLFSGILLCRLDYLLLVGPVAAFLLWKRMPLRPVLAGLAPLVAWELFSLVYYGALVPNTALAKLGGGLSLGDRLQHGWTYLATSVQNDPVTGLVILGAVVHGLWRDRTGVPRAWALGLVFYVGYVWIIGGDFMAGRFLAAPFVVSLVILTRAVYAPRYRAGLAFLVLAAGLSLNLPALYSPRFGHDLWPYLGDTEVSDERVFYYPHTGLFRQPRGDAPNTHPWVAEGRAAGQAGATPVTRNAVGFYGYFAGPDITIVDLFGLCDPLLARLPAADTAHWRAGHLEREVPEGYLECVATDRPMQGETEIARLENKVKLAARGPLFSKERWRAILDLHFNSGP